MLVLLLVLAQIPNPPGQRYDIGGGTHLHLNCTGTGSPTVVLEAGFPGCSLDWTLVQPEAAKLTRVCSYDRAGLGWSDAAKLPRSSEQVATELHQLLAAAKIPRPYILVGHSFGGLLVRTFTRLFPDNVIGMVLVDATHEDQWDFEPRRYYQPGTPPTRLKAPDINRPTEVNKILQQMWATERWKMAERAERNAMSATIADAQKQTKRLPVIPLIVLSAGEEAAPNDSLGILKGQQLQREMAAFSPLGKWIAVPGAHHYIQVSHPAIVVKAISDVVETSRKLAPH